MFLIWDTLFLNKTVSTKKQKAKKSTGKGSKSAAASDADVSMSAREGDSRKKGDSISMKASPKRTSRKGKHKPTGSASSSTPRGTTVAPAPNK